MNNDLQRHLANILNICARVCRTPFLSSSLTYRPVSILACEGIVYNDGFLNFKLSLFIKNEKDVAKILQIFSFFGGPRAKTRSKKAEKTRPRLEKVT